MKREARQIKIWDIGLQRPAGIDHDRPPKSPAWATCRSSCPASSSLTSAFTAALDEVEHTLGPLDLWPLPAYCRDRYGGPVDRVRDSSASQSRPVRYQRYAAAFMPALTQDGGQLLAADERPELAAALPLPPAVNSAIVLRADPAARACGELLTGDLAVRLRSSRALLLPGSRSPAVVRSRHRSRPAAGAAGPPGRGAEPGQRAPPAAPGP